MRFAILGTGGVGGYFGARLAAAGHEVVFLARGAHFEAIKRDGLRVQSALGDILLDHVNVVDNIDKINDVDVVIVTVKLTDTAPLLPHVGRLGRQGAVVISLQNGVEKDMAISRHVTPNQVIGAVCFINAHVEKPGLIVHTGQFHRIIMGETSGKSTERLESIAQALETSKVDVQISDRIRTVTWEKFVFLVGFSAMTSATALPIGPVRGNPASRAMLLRILEEVVAVAGASGITLANDFADKQLAFCDTLAEGARASMAHDIQAGRSSELRWLSGWVVDAGRRLGVNTPMNEAVVALLGPRTQS